MEHDINLNIHYTAPQEVWEKIYEAYASMPYWVDHAEYPCWKGQDIDLCASVEASGIQITGTMPQVIWEGWIASLKEQLTLVLGYAIGDAEDGFDFHIYE